LVEIAALYATKVVLKTESSSSLGLKLGIFESSEDSFVVGARNGIANGFNDGWPPVVVGGQEGLFKLC
jgi:hypothetical protein